MTFEIVNDQERLDIGIRSSSISHISVMKVLFVKQHTDIREIL